jgi:hypothetical protein
VAWASNRVLRLIASPCRETPIVLAKQRARSIGGAARISQWLRMGYPTVAYTTISGLVTHSSMVLNPADDQREETS